MAARRAISAAILVLVLGLAGGLARSQPANQPTNNLPNPYQAITGWAKLPEGRTWGSTSAVEIDKDGRSSGSPSAAGPNSCLDARRAR